MLAIDALEDELAPLDPGIDAVRELISSFELCHHKAGRWVANIIEAIGAGQTAKGLGTRDRGRRHDAETVWEEVCNALSSWCAGQPASSFEGTVGTVSVADLISLIGARTPLKEWQVQRVIEKVRSLVDWPPASDDPSAGFAWILFSEGTDGSSFRHQCPQRFADHDEQWRTTVRTIIRDRHDGREAPISLGLAIDMLWPCHWDFLDNLRLVLGAIGGALDPDRPFTACGRNIQHLPERRYYQLICETLQKFCGAIPATGNLDAEVLERLGTPTAEKQWLAASLDKTLRLQLDPPAALRRLYDFPGPDWIHDR
jgi:hypothetical protein